MAGRRKRKTYQELEQPLEQQAAVQTLEWPTAVYARLSIENSGKDDKEESIDGQIEICRDYVEEHPYLHYVETYVDNGWTGTNTNRPAFQRLLSDIQAGKIKALVIKDFSRFSRDYIEAGNLLENIFPACGVRFISVADRYDSFMTDGSSSSLLIPLKNLINSYYSKDISRKVSSAVHARQLAGAHIPSMIPYGYRKSTTEEYRFEPDPETSGNVTRIFQMRVDGVPVNQIAKRMDKEGIPSPGKLRYLRGLTTDKRYATSKWSAQLVKQILKNPTYLGDMVFGRMPTALYLGKPNYQYEPDESKWRVLKNMHEPLVTQEVFDRAKEMEIAGREAWEKKMEKSAEIRAKNVPIFHDHLFCGDCGAHMHYHRSLYQPERLTGSYECPNYKYSRCAQTHTISIANQRALLHQYLNDHKEFMPYETIEFVDDGYSGTNGDRPGFEKMIEFLRDGGAKLVLCKDLSRFFRDYVEIGDYLERIFPFLGVRLIAVNDGYDSDDYKGTTAGMDVVMKCIVYGFYSKDLSQKIKTVLTAKQKKGQYIGSYPPYGYLKDPADRHHLVPDPVAAPVIRSIFDMAMDGKTTGEIAKALNADHVEPPAAHFHRVYPNSRKFQKTTSRANCWNCTNVYEMLKRREYTGAVVAQKKKYKGIDQPQTITRAEAERIVVENCHEAIVTKEEFERAQEAIISEGKYETKKQSYLLRTLVRCGVCGRTMSRRKRGTYTEAYYKCDKNRYIEDSPCPIGERFYEPELEKLVIAFLSQILQAVVDEDKRLQEAAAKTKGTAENIRRTVLKLEQSIKQSANAKLEAYEQYSEGKLSREQFIQIRNSTSAETEAMEAEKASLEQQLADLSKAEDAGSHELASAGSAFLKAENVTNQMLMTFIEKVLVYSGGRIEIVYRFQNPFAEIATELPLEEHDGEVSQ